MVDLVFTAEGVDVERYAVTPTLKFRLRIANATPDMRVQNVLLQCQVRIEATQRLYAPEELDRLVELFGEAHRWGETLRSMLWTHTTLQAPAFEEECLVDMPVSCSFDFNVAATKYFDGLAGGEVPLAFLFSGTVFYRDTDGFLQMDQIAWSKEAGFRLPVQIWKAMMDAYYPDSVWLRIGREVFEDIHSYKRSRGCTSWEEAFRALLKRQREETLS